MESDSLKTKFARIGARLKVVDRPTRRFRTGNVLSLDVRTDRHGEFFEIAARADTQTEVEILDVQPADRHLLLLVREGPDKNKYLCGHDERHWFVAGIPERAPVGTVRQAKEALQPSDVQSALGRKRVGGKARLRRKNAAFVRQGEWFFLPVRDMVIDAALVLRTEPLHRGAGGKAHWAEFCYRTGGETVYLCSRYPQGVPETMYRAILANNRGAARWNWQTARRNPGVFVRGHVRHSDHRTIMLHGWHQVLMNTENQSRAMRHVTFLD
jgi:hypothetical protein